SLTDEDSHGSACTTRASVAGDRQEWVSRPALSNRPASPSTAKATRPVRRISEPVSHASSGNSYRGLCECRLHPIVRRHQEASSSPIRRNQTRGADLFLSSIPPAGSLTHIGV